MRCRTTFQLAITAAIVALHWLLPPQRVGLSKRRQSELFRRRKHSNADPWTSPFGRMLRDPETRDPASHAHSLFRRRTRIPYAMLSSLVTLFEDPLRSLRGVADACGKVAAPLELKILACLYILGRAGTYDDAEMLCGISKTVIKEFFVHFVMTMAGTQLKEFAIPSVLDTKFVFYAIGLYDQFIYPPRQDGDLPAVLQMYEHLGFPGCVGSTDCVHILWDRCPQAQRILYGSRYGRPTIAYSFVVDHTRRIRSVTPGHPGSRNDKAIIRFDKFVNDLKYGRLYPDATFEGFGSDGTKVALSGYYLLCDGGYHRWRILQCPNRFANYEWESKWSKQIESVRNDVECTFGILKRRFRILKVASEVRNKTKIDNIMFTCAITSCSQITSCSHVDLLHTLLSKI